MPTDLEEPRHPITREYLNDAARDSRILQHVNQAAANYGDAAEETSIVPALNRLVRLSRQWSERRADGARGDKHAEYAASVARAARETYGLLLAAIEKKVSGVFNRPDIASLREAVGRLCALAVRHCLDFEGPTRRDEKPAGLGVDRLAGQDFAQLSALYYFYEKPELGQACRLVASGFYAQNDRAARARSRARALATALFAACGDEDFVGVFGNVYVSNKSLDWSHEAFSMVHSNLTRVGDRFVASLPHAPEQGDALLARLDPILDSLAVHVTVVAALLRDTHDEELYALGEIVRYRFLRDSSDWWCAALFVLLLAHSCECLLAAREPRPEFAPERADVVERLCGLAEALAARRPEEVKEALDAARGAAACASTLLRYYALLALDARVAARGDGYVLELGRGRGSYGALECSAGVRAGVLHMHVAREPLMATPWPTVGEAASLNEAFAEDCAFVAAWGIRAHQREAPRAVVVTGVARPLQLLRRIGDVEIDATTSREVAVFPSRGEAGESGSSREASPREPPRPRKGWQAETWQSASTNLVYSLARCQRYLYLTALTEEQKLWCRRLDAADRVVHILRRASNETSGEAPRYAKRQFLLAAYCAHRTLSGVFRRGHRDEERPDVAPALSLTGEAFDAAALVALSGLRAAIRLSEERLMGPESFESRYEWTIWSLVSGSRARPVSKTTGEARGVPRGEPERRRAVEGNAYGCGIVASGALASEAYYTVDPFGAAARVESTFRLAPTA